MKGIPVIILLAVMTYSSEGYTVPQLICPPGEYQIVEYDILDPKTGEHISLSDMPITKCVKDDYEKTKKPKQTKKPKKTEKPDDDKVETFLQILKYGHPHGIGQSFSSMSQCTQEQARLTKENAGLDYSYKCMKK